MSGSDVSISHTKLIDSDLGGKTRDVVLHFSRRFVTRLLVRSTLAGRSRTFGEEALLQTLQTG